tara:strand:- start:88 stop:1422 length:1335 start_codon:yes stop_codon:yes gene_type:complete
MNPNVTIIGRPNVGKSTLFNCLISKRKAIVNNTPGVTRDWNDALFNYSNFSIRIIDTPGINNETKDEFEKKLNEKTFGLIKKTDLIIFVIDAKAGVTSDDFLIFKKIRKFNKEIIIVFNKTEGKNTYDINDAYKLGVPDIISLSAEHSLGIDCLTNQIKLNLTKNKKIQESEPVEEVKKINIAVVGRPNVGKSTLINSLINEERLITGLASGITRDSIDVSWNINGYKIILNDTAGIRKNSKISDKIESLSVIQTKKTINLSEVVLLIVDGNLGIDSQDLKIAKLVVDEGRCLIIIINKIDLVKDINSKIQEIKNRLNKSLHQAKGVSTVNISAEKKIGLGGIFISTLNVYRVWNKRISTRELNNWLEVVIERHPPPSISGKRIKLKYITQTKARPPTFVIFSTKADKVPNNYLNYLINEIRNEFKFPGVPIRMHIRKSKNPYV